MPTRWNPREHFELGWYACKWLLIAAPVGAAIGGAVAVFLWTLNWATQTRFSTETASGLPWTLYLLPVAGLAVGLMYHFFGKSIEAGNNLIIDQIHEPGGGVPSRMAPLVLIGTVITHLFGGSAGREGTAVQMGGSIASRIGRWMRLNENDTRTLLMCGVAAGFGAVFGTPLTGAIFAVEVLAIGIIRFQSIVPCLIASIVGDQISNLLITRWHVGHTHYKIASMIGVGQTPELNWLLLGKVAIASVAFGLASTLFAELTHGLGAMFKRTIRWSAARPLVGGLIVIALARLIGPDFLGLGVVDAHHPDRVTIVSSFLPGGAHAWSWWWKILFTAVTLSSGFKGGEVTPLFFVGAALGNTMARILHAPVDLFAGLGFVAVFAGATNTPLACTIMGIELFAAGQAELIHSGLVVYLAVACFLTYLLSGNSRIYQSQRLQLETPNATS